MANDQASQLMPRRLWNSNNNNYNNNLWNSDYPAQTPSLWSTVERSDNFSGYLRQKRKTEKKISSQVALKGNPFMEKRKGEKGGKERMESSFSAKKGKKVGGGKSTWLTRGKWWKIDGAKYTSRVGEKKSGRKPRKIGRKKQKKKKEISHYGADLPNVPASKLFISHKLESERASKASSTEQVNKWVVQPKKPTDEWVAQYLRLDTWLYWTIVPLSLLSA